MRFEQDFRSLTGFDPLSWQARLYTEHFASAAIPAAVDIPTGLGKTAVMALWLIARARGVDVPRRLVYVVDRRAVVDQATAFAAALRERLDTHAAHLKAGLHLNGRSLPISTLRGQYVDNREWLEDPASPAIIVGTVDMIGSRLLFGGYGVSRKMRPYHAGLLGADALIALDEAHLVPPFERLLEAIEAGPREFGPHGASDRQAIPAFRLLSLSATGGDRIGEVFRLEGSFDEPAGRRADLDDGTVARRLKAEKAITIVPMRADKLEDSLAAYAWDLAEQGAAPIRCLIFSNSRETSEKAKRQIESLARGDKRRGIANRQIDRELFVGARRVRERQKVMETWLREQGFLAGSVVERTQPAFLFATSAGEVGVDLDADHIVCDIVAWERLVQRLGRVNRRGERSAKVLIVDAGAPTPKKKGEPTPEELAEIQRREALLQLLDHLPEVAPDSRLASPEALRTLKKRAASDPELAATLKAATTAAPLRPALTRAVVDAWSMTSLEEHTGRPEIAPWLRGWVDDRPQTVVIWRKYLPVRKEAGAAKSDIEAFFEAAPPHASERLETDTFLVADWLQERCSAALADARNADQTSSGASKTAPESGDASPSTERLSTKGVLGFLLSQSGDLIDTLRIEEFADLKTDRGQSRALERKLRKLAGQVLIVDARLGGLDGGLLNAGCSETADTADGDAWMAADLPQPVVRFRVRMASVSGEQDVANGWQERYRFIIERDEDGVPLRWLTVDKWRGDSANEEDRSESIHEQVLSEHQSWAEKRARSLATQMGARDDIAEALAVAARLHDEGKRSSRWQRAFRAPKGIEPYAKTKGPISFELLDGYRHEFGSLAWVEKDVAFKALPENSKDLVLHLVAAHHGQARPVISTRSCDDAPPSALEERARLVALRFARLQKRWGPWGLAWIESLLRAADQQASRENDERSAEKPNG